MLSPDMPQSLDAWGNHFHAIYGKRNRESRRSAATFLLKVAKRALRLQSPKFPTNLDAFGYELGFAFAWYCAFMRQRVGGEIAHALICEFPCACPYCTKPKCECTADRGDRRRSWARTEGERIIRVSQGKCLRVGIQGWADELARIYPEDQVRSIDYCWSKWGEELGEVIEALEDFAHHTQHPNLSEYQEDLVSETMDALCRFVTFARRVIDSSDNRDTTLDSLVWRVFEHGCPICQQEACVCGDTTATRKRDRELRRELEHAPLLFEKERVRKAPRPREPRRAAPSPPQTLNVNVFVNIEQEASRLATEARGDAAVGEQVASAIESMIQEFRGAVAPESVEQQVEIALERIPAEHRPKWRQKLAAFVARLGEAVVSPEVAAKVFEAVARIGSGQSTTA